MWVYVLVAAVGTAPLLCGGYLQRHTPRHWIPLLCIWFLWVAYLQHYAKLHSELLAEWRIRNLVPLPEECEPLTECEIQALFAQDGGRRYYEITQAKCVTLLEARE